MKKYVVCGGYMSDLVVRHYDKTRYVLASAYEEEHAARVAAEKRVGELAEMLAEAETYVFHAPICRSSDDCDCGFKEMIQKLQSVLPLSAFLEITAAAILNQLHDAAKGKGGTEE